MQLTAQPLALPMPAISRWRRWSGCAPASHSRPLEIAQVEAAAGWSSALALFTWHDFELVVIHDHDGTGAELADEIRVRWGQVPTLIFKEKLILN
jgi:hypothetical protein